MYNANNDTYSTAQPLGIYLQGNYFFKLMII